MASQVDICNIALSNLGQSPDIVSVNPPDGGKYAASCAQFYPIALDKVLGECDWHFAVKEVLLSVVFVAMPDAWQYAYALPNDLVKPVNAFPQGIGSPFCSAEFEVRGNVLFTNTQDIVLRYVYRNTATSNYSNAFVLALAAYLSHLLAAPVTKDPNVTSGWMKMYKSYLAEAMIDNRHRVRVVHDDTANGVLARWA